MGEKPVILGEPPLGAYEMSPHGRFKAVGPTRPASAAHRPQLPEVGLDWAWPCLNTGIELVLSGFASVVGLHLVQLSLNRHSDTFCDFMSGQSCGRTT